MQLGTSPLGRGPIAGTKALTVPAIGSGTLTALANLATITAAVRGGVTNAS